MNGSSDSTGPLADQIGNRKTNIHKEKPPLLVTPPPREPFLRSVLSDLTQVSNSQLHHQTTQMENVHHEVERKKIDK